MSKPAATALVAVLFAVLGAVSYWLTGERAEKCAVQAPAPSPTPTPEAGPGARSAPEPEHRVTASAQRW